MDRQQRTSRGNYRSNPRDNPAHRRLRASQQAIRQAKYYLLVPKEYRDKGPVLENTQSAKMPEKIGLSRERRV